MELLLRKENIEIHTDQILQKKRKKKMFQRKTVAHRKSNNNHTAVYIDEK